MKTLHSTVSDITGRYWVWVALSKPPMCAALPEKIKLPSTCILSNNSIIIGPTCSRLLPLVHAPGQQVRLCQKFFFYAALPQSGNSGNLTIFIATSTAAITYIHHHLINYTFLQLTWVENRSRTSKVMTGISRKDHIFPSLAPH